MPEGGGLGEDPSLVVPLIRDKALRLAARLGDAAAAGARVDLQEEGLDLAVRLILHQFFRIGGTDDDEAVAGKLTAELLQSMHGVQDALMESTMLWPPTLPAVALMPWSAAAARWAAPHYAWHRALDRVMDAALARAVLAAPPPSRQEEGAKGGDGGSGGPGGQPAPPQARTYLESLLLLRESDYPGADGGRRAGGLLRGGPWLKSQISASLAGGADTVGHALATLMMCIAGAPAVQARLAAELDRAGLLATADRPEPRLVEPADLAPGRLPYLAAVIKESLRLFPPTAIAMWREADRDMALGGYAVPRGTHILASTYATHLSPANFEGPAAFDPGRWLPGGSGNAAAYLGFSSGARSCIGQQIALAQLTTVAATLCGRLRFELCEDMGGLDGARARELSHSTLCIDGGVWVKVQSRTGAAARAEE